MPDNSAITRLPASNPGNGRVQRARPAPFQRPRIELDATGAQQRRVWRQIPAYKLKKGDIVPDVGRLYQVAELALIPPANSGLTAWEIADAVTWSVTVWGGLNNSRIFHGGEQVYAFTAEDEPEETG